MSKRVDVVPISTFGEAIANGISDKELRFEPLRPTGMPVLVSKLQRLNVHAIHRREKVNCDISRFVFLVKFFVVHARDFFAVLCINALSLVKFFKT